MVADHPTNEAERLDALRSYQVLDTLPEASIDDITRLASEICGTPIALVSLVDEDRQWFKSRQGLDATETPRDVAFCAHAILEPDLLIVPDAREDARFADSPLVRGDPRIVFYAGAPLQTSKGLSLGTLCVIDQVRRTLTTQQADSLRALSRQVMAQLELRRHALEQQRYQQRLEEAQKLLEQANARLLDESLTDDVSGYHNTRFLHHFLDDYLEQTETESRRLSLVFFDMDGFKQVVDRHGHLLGALTLREVAHAVGGTLASEDRLVRYGGDEFVVILPGQDHDEALAKAEQMRLAIRETRFLPEHGLDVRLTASFGLATFPSDAAGKESLLQAADRCLFQSKARGKDRVSYEV